METCQGSRTSQRAHQSARLDLFHCLFQTSSRNCFWFLPKILLKKCSLFDGNLVKFINANGGRLKLCWPQTSLVNAPKLRAAHELVYNFHVIVFDCTQHVPPKKDVLLFKNSGHFSIWGSRKLLMRMSSTNSLPLLAVGVCGRIFCQFNSFTQSYYSLVQCGSCEQLQFDQHMRNRHTLHGLQRYGKSSDVTIPEDFAVTSLLPGHDEVDGPQQCPSN